MFLTMGCLRDTSYSEYHIKYCPHLVETEYTIMCGDFMLYAAYFIQGLANAEEEVHSLKATLKDAEGQRDKYKSQLAKTNSELTCSEAYAQMSMATGQKAASSKSYSAATETVDEPALMQPPSKRARGTGEEEALARQPQQASKRLRRGTSTSDPEALGSGHSSRVRPTGNSSSGRSSGGGGVGSGSDFRKGVKGKGRAKPSFVRNQVTVELRSDQESHATDSNRSIYSDNGTAPSAGGAEAASTSVSTSWEQRRDAENVDISSSSDDDRSGATSGNLGDSFNQSLGRSTGTTLTQPRSLHDEGKGSGGGRGRKESGVEQQDSDKDSDGWVPPWRDGSEAGSAGGDVSIYDSDDAPSMFF